MAIEFTPPEFVSGNDPDEIQERMMNNLPADIDNMPGGFPFDFTMPTALEKSELIQFHLVRTLMLMFPMWAWGEWLDYHAKAAGIERRPAGYASGVITVEGLAGTQIPSGTIFATAATAESSSIDFKTSEPLVIGESGIIEIKVSAVEAGKLSNVPAGTVVLLSKPIKGITSITNKQAITGGTERENDEILRERIQEANESESTSYVGNDSDYIRWAKEVVGVGTAIVVAEWNGPGSVKLVILDVNGQPANGQIISDVLNHIISPEDRLQRKAPIGATLTVVAPDVISITYSAKVILSPGYETKLVIEDFKKNLLKYYEMAKNEGVLKYTKLASTLSDTNGVSDYEDFLVNGDMQNITLREDEYPETTAVIFE